MIIFSPELHQIPRSLVSHLQILQRIIQVIYRTCTFSTMAGENFITLNHECYLTKEIFQKITDSTMGANQVRSDNTIMWLPNSNTPLCIVGYNRRKINDSIFYQLTYIKLAYDNFFFYDISNNKILFN